MSRVNHSNVSKMVVCAVLAATAPTWGAEEAKVGAVALSGDAARGQPLYRRYCVGCHGPKGDGRGENAPFMDPRPRDFTAGAFKCRSTPTGSLPQDTDVLATIKRGIYASAMPSWVALTPQQRVDLLAYLKDFSPRYQSDEPPSPLHVPQEPAGTPESVSRGAKIYDRMECWKCHGKDGSGNGPSAYTLTDNKERPIVPYDFTKGSRFKCGQTNEDLYRIFMTGLDGTPMPSFHDNMQSDEAWDLVHYLRTLQERVKK
jgi:mono/diheme cytochrome c family protein